MISVDLKQRSHFSAGHQTGSKRTPAYEKMTSTLNAIGRHEEALAHANQAIQLAPNDPLAITTRA